jgi:type IX secretion system PorP/SprF family membrane protein
MQKLIIFYLFYCCSIVATAQDFSYSQFYEKPLLRNPALAGVFDGDVRVSGIFRNQWQSVTVPYKTGAASVEVKLPFGKGEDWLTVGLQSTLDQAGDIKLKRTQLLPVVNFHKALSGEADNYISVAFMAGPVNNQFDPTQLKLGDQWVNGSFNAGNPTAQVFNRTGMNYWDASTGVVYSGGWNEGSHFYAGVGVFHFNRPKVAFYTNNSNTVLQPKLTLNAGISTETSDNNRLEFYADYMVQAGHRQFIGGALYGTKLAEDIDSDRSLSFYAGGLYRFNDAVIPVLKLDIYRLGIGLSYDLNVSQLTSASGWRGGFELSMSYKASLNSRSYNAGQVRCPRF